MGWINKDQPGSCKMIAASNSCRHLGFLFTTTSEKLGLRSKCPCTARVPASWATENIPAIAAGSTEAQVCKLFQKFRAPKKVQKSEPRFHGAQRHLETSDEPRWRKARQLCWPKTLFSSSSIFLWNACLENRHAISQETCCLVCFGDVADRVCPVFDSQIEEWQTQGKSVKPNSKRQRSTDGWGTLERNLGVCNDFSDSSGIKWHLPVGCDTYRSWERSEEGR